MHIRLIWPNHPILPIAAPSPIWLKLFHSLSFLGFLTTSFYSTEHFAWAISVHSCELRPREQFPLPQAPTSLCIHRFREQLRNRFPKQIVLLLSTIPHPFHSDSPSSGRGAQSSKHGKLCYTFTGWDACCTWSWDCRQGLLVLSATGKLLNLIGHVCQSHSNHHCPQDMDLYSSSVWVRF